MLGWAMKHFKWPRPPLVLGFILGEVIERYMFISIERYGVGWMLQPVVIVMFILAGHVLLRPLLAGRSQPRRPQEDGLALGPSAVSANNLFPAALLCLFVVMLSQSFDWAFAARIVPTIVGIGAMLFCSLSLLNDVFGLHERDGGGRERRRQVAEDPHGHRFEDRASARQDHPARGVLVFRLDGRLPAA